jgi:hypothetical protein
MASSRSRVQNYTAHALGPVENRGFSFYSRPAEGYSQEPKLSHKAKGSFVCPDDKPPQHGHMSYAQTGGPGCGDGKSHGTYAEFSHNHPVYGVVYGSIVPYPHEEHILGPLVD